MTMACRYVNFEAAAKITTGSSGREPAASRTIAEREKLATSDGVYPRMPPAWLLRGVARRAADREGRARRSGARQVAPAASRSPVIRGSYRSHAPPAGPLPV